MIRATLHFFWYIFHFRTLSFVLYTFTKVMISWCIWTCFSSLLTLPYIVGHDTCSICSGWNLTAFCYPWKKGSTLKRPGKMPLSPSPRRSRSPAWETYHKRNNSFGNVLPVKSKDDELALFSDMQKVETENFLLEPSEDFDDSIGSACKFHLPPFPYSLIVLYIFFVTIFNLFLSIHQQNWAISQK